MILIIVKFTFIKDISIYLQNNLILAVIVFRLHFLIEDSFSLLISLKEAKLFI